MGGFGLCTDVAAQFAMICAAFRMSDDDRACAEIFNHLSRNIACVSTANIGVAVLTAARDGPAHAARRGERTLRHVSFHASDADISSHSEALVRLYAATPIDVESLSLAQALNIRTMSDTAVGLFGGGFAEVVAEEEPEALIASIIEAMRRDERVTAALARASEGSEQ